MLMPPQGVRILVATKPVDFRKGHDGLAALVQSTLAEDPFTGTVFVFRSKRAEQLKILFWDGSGLVISTAFASGRACISAGTSTLA